MKKKIRKMLREIGRRGGVVVMPTFLPDEVAEQFLEQVLACPDCCAASGSFIGGGDTIDHVLAGRTPKTASDH